MSNILEQIMLVEKHAPSCLCEGIWMLSANHSDMFFFSIRIVFLRNLFTIPFEVAYSYVIHLLSILFCLCTCHLPLMTLQSSLIPEHKLEALVYDILPSTTAVFSYAIGSRKLSANEQFLLLLVVVLKQ